MTTGTLCAAQPTRNKPITGIRNRIEATHKGYPDLHIDRTNAERQRRRREREALGSLFMRGDMPLNLVSVLVERGYLEGGASLDPVCRGQALVDFALHHLKK